MLGEGVVHGSGEVLDCVTRFSLFVTVRRRGNLNRSRLNRHTARWIRLLSCCCRSSPQRGVMSGRVRGTRDALGRPQTHDPSHRS